MKSFMFISLRHFFVPMSAIAEEPKRKINDQWHFELNPLYLWFLSMEGNTIIAPSGGNPGGTSNLGEGRLTSAFSIHFEAGKGD